MMKELLEQYAQKKEAIKERLRDFKRVWQGDERDIFAELCFCICTPQSKAVYCDRAVSGLAESGALFSGSREDIREGLKAVRFPNNKAGYIFETRERLTREGNIRIKERIDEKDIKATRDWLVRNIKGIGYKEASHFLRNIGFGRDLAILDVHIIKNMLRYGLVDERPVCISRKCYFELEKKLEGFSRSIDIPMDELDILFWSAQTGTIFK
ncbi:MAG: N-glycosylase/DNA lyase [Candidatus Omnitrophica bacterium]|nr:N-glycosylase/DNA lyase [Candidatus Omnitrophota bacterium]